MNEPISYREKLSNSSKQLSPLGESVLKEPDFICSHSTCHNSYCKMIFLKLSFASMYAQKIFLGFQALISATLNCGNWLLQLSTEMKREPCYVENLNPINIQMLHFVRPRWISFLTKAWFFSFDSATDSILRDSDLLPNKLSRALYYSWRCLSWLTANKEAAQVKGQPKLL